MKRLAALLVSTALTLQPAYGQTVADSAKAAIGTSGFGLYWFGGAVGLGYSDGTSAKPKAVMIPGVELADIAVLPTYQGKGTYADDTTPLNTFVALHPGGLRIASAIKLSGTVQLPPSSRVVCDNSERYIIDDTAVVGANAFQVGKPDGSQAASSFSISGCRFIKFNTYDTGVTTNVPGGTYTAGITTSITNLQTQAEAHLAVYGGQFISITDNWFTNKPYNIILSSAVIVNVDRNNFGGVWDRAQTRMQETIAEVWIKADAHYGTSQTALFTRNYFSGGLAAPYRFHPLGTLTNTNSGCTPLNASAPSAPVIASNTPTDSSQTNCAPWYAGNVGPAYAVKIDYLEGGWFHHNYLGAMSTDGILLAPAAAVGSNPAGISQFSIDHNFFDSVGDGQTDNTGYVVHAASPNAGTVSPIASLRLDHNTYNGQLNGMGAVNIQPGVSNSTYVPSLYGLQMSDEEIANYAETPVNLSGCTSCDVHENKIAASNVWNAAPTSNPNIDACILAITPAASLIRAVNNECGGQTNAYIGTGNFIRNGIAFQSTATGEIRSTINAGMGLTGGSLESGNIPATSSAACFQGQEATDTSGTRYRCIANNTWVKYAAPSTF